MFKERASFLKQIVPQVILLMFLGFGIFSIYSFAKTGVMPNTENIVNFLVAGLTLFAPYLVNQFASLFEKLAPKK